MKLLSFVVVLVYVLGHHNSLAVTCTDETSSSNCDCSVSCSSCQTRSCCSNECNCCQTTTRSPITTTTNPYSTTTGLPITATTNPYSTTTSQSSTDKPPSDETNIDIRLVNVINTTNDINVPIGISLVNRNNVIQLRHSSSNSTACRKIQCTPSSPEGTDWETITTARSPRIEQPSSTAIPLSTTTPSRPVPACAYPEYPCQNDSINELLGIDNQQIPEASPNVTEGGIYGIPISTHTPPQQSELTPPLVAKWILLLQKQYQLANIPNNELPTFGYFGHQTPYNQFGGYQYLQPLAMPYDQPLGSSYNQPLGSSYSQPLGSSHIQPPWSPYIQPTWSSYNQPLELSYNQPLGSSYNTLIGMG